MKGKGRLATQLLIALLPSLIKVPLYRAFFGARIGPGVRIGFGALLLFDTLELGAGTRIGPLTLIRVRHLRAGIRCRIGMLTRVIAHRMDLGPSVTIGPQVSILADDGDPRAVFEAGAESWVFEYCYINPARPIRLGRNVGIGGGSYLFTHGFWLPKLDGYPVAYGEIDIGNDVWLPWGCFIMPGVSIGDGAVVGARSVVTKSVPAGSLVAGSPAKVLRDQVATDPGIPAKIEILEEATREFASRRKRQLDVRHGAEWVVFELDRVPEIAISRLAVAPPIPVELETALVLVHERLSALQRRPERALSLKTYQSTPRRSLSAEQAAWLTHLRLIGTRFYPVDEVDVEGLGG